MHMLSRRKALWDSCNSCPGLGKICRNATISAPIQRTHTTTSSQGQPICESYMTATVLRASWPLTMLGRGAGKTILQAVNHYPKRRRYISRTSSRSSATAQPTAKLTSPLWQHRGTRVRCFPRIQQRHQSTFRLHMRRHRQSNQPTILCRTGRRSRRSLKGCSSRHRTRNGRNERHWRLSCCGGLWRAFAREWWSAQEPMNGLQDKSTDLRGAHVVDGYRYFSHLALRTCWRAGHFIVQFQRSERRRPERLVCIRS